MYRYCTLEKTSMEQLAECFNEAFADYEQPMSFTAQSLQYYLTASAVNLSLSFGAFYDGQLVGFILNSDGIYNNQNVVFDAGTGIVPQHRGKRVFSSLFEYTCTQLKKSNITEYYLEVLQANHHAISVYRKKGFSVCREYAVLGATGAGDGAEGVTVTPYQQFAAFPTDFSVKPSFEHTLHTINRNPHLYQVASLDGSAYCIHAKRNGLILQMHYNDLDSLKAVIAGIITRYPRAWAKNVDFSNGEVIEMLTNIGFTEVTRQYEMVRKI